jgi:hypothetical protein
MDNGIKDVYDSIHYFKDVNPHSYQLLGYLGYNKESESNTPYGSWTIYTKKEFSFPYFNTEFSSPVNKFAAVYKGTGKNMFVFGAFEKSAEEIKQNLLLLTNTMLAPVKKFLGIPLTLTEENAQDYGYIRGVILGIIIIMADFVYSWTFKLQEGILTGFIEYIKRVYDGNPGLGNAIGFAWTGMYFGLPLILMPIMYGNLCVWRAARSRQKRLQQIEKMLAGYEFGLNAENALEEELTTIIEEKKKRIIYDEVKKMSKKLSRQDFETLYIQVQEGFLSPDTLLNFINNLREMAGENPTFEKFVEIVARYHKSDIVTELGIKPAVEKGKEP